MASRTVLPNDIQAIDNSERPADDLLHDRILAEGVHVSKKKGDFLCREGEVASDVYAMTSGIAGVAVHCDHATRHYLFFLTPPGLMVPPIDSQGKAIYSIECLGQSEFYTVSRRAMMRLMSGNRLGLAIEINLGKTLRRANDYLSNLLCRHGAERVAYLLANLASAYETPSSDSEGGTHTPIDLTQVELASALGMSPVYLNQIIKEFKASGFLSIKSGKIIINQLKSLRLKYGNT